MTPGEGHAQTLATSYLSPTTDSLWRWSGDGEVLTWDDGSTIAFRQEVEGVVQRVAPHGLPPFGAIVLLLAACRGGWEQSPGREAYLRSASAFAIRRGEPKAGANPAPHLVVQHVQRGLKQVVDGLDVVGRLPPGIRQWNEAKAVLAEVVFEVSKNRRLSPAESELVVRALADGVNHERVTLRFGGGDALRELADDADALRQGLALVNEKSLALRRRTGLDEIPGTADADLAPGDRVRRLLAELRQDKELSGVARLAQDLMAAVHVPRSLRQQEELPLGGVSDLSNRGPLDRLLVSELAHDDLTLAARVAVNEALYLRRESPPRQPPNRRAILIDAGIRMWGVPRVFGTAVALALAATGDAHAELLVFRATAGGVETVDLTSRAGLVACLEALEAAPHPGGAVAPFLAAIAAGGEGHTDAMLVTHPDVIADRDFAAALRDLDHPDLYVAAVDRDGGFSLAALTRSGRKPVRDAKLSLDAIISGADGLAKTAGGGTQAGHRLIVKDLDPDLPAILAVEPFPLRLPHVADPKLARASQRHGLVAVAADGRLLHWDHARQAARQLTALLPPGRPRGVWIDDDAGRVHVLFDQTRGARCRLITADLSTGHTTAAPVQPSASGSMAACVRGGVLFLAFRQKDKPHRYAVECFDLASGAPAGRTSGDDVELLRDRFFRAHDGWQALAHDGTGPTFVKIPRPPGAASPDASVLSFFDRAGHDGPWAVLSDGRVVNGAGKDADRRFVKLPVKWKFVGVSTDGNRIVLGGFENHLLDMSTDEDARPVVGDVAEALLVPQIYWSTRYSPVVRNDFASAFLANGLLSLATAKQEVFQIDTDNGGEFILKQVGQVGSVPSPAPFKPISPPRGMRIGLSTAKWADGSRAFLDSRGLLHLKSSDRSIPEVSLVLTGEKLAGWSSAGRLFGPRQFIGDAPAAPAKEFAAVIDRFVSKLRVT